MRTFTLIAAAAAVAFGLSTAPAVADSYSFSYSTSSHKTPKHYGGSGYRQGYKYGNKLGYGYQKPYYRYQKPYFGRYLVRPGDHRAYRPGLSKFGFGRANYGYRQYGYSSYRYDAPRLSKHRLIRHLNRQRFSHVKRIRFSRGFYDVFARDHYGRKVKLKLDPYTGRIVAWRYRG